MRVMVIGSGGREHALVWKIARSPLIRSRDDLFCVPGNGGIEADARCLAAPAGGLADVAALAALAREHRIDFTVVGPELPLSMGVVDEFARCGMPCFGASRAAARLEASKVFSKEFMARHAIPTAAFEVFDSTPAALEYLAAAGRRFPIVVKADGLAAGKGVVVAPDRASAEAAVRSMLEQRHFGAAGERIVIEECLVGTEVSFFAMTDGRDVVPLASCQDYKRALDGDRGPNTGGMGAYCPSIEVDAALEAEILRRVIVPAVRGMAQEGALYRGVIYAGLMLTASGPMVLEFNARFGDPETQVLMPRVAGDVLPLMMWAAGMQDAGAGPVAWRSEWAACIVLASRGYPESSESGRPIEGLDAAGAMPDTFVFHAGTRKGATASGGDGMLTNGGRVLAVVCLGAELRDAVDRAGAAVARISFDGMQHRTDIGRAAVSKLTRARKESGQEP
jgi:phosphoribosylamine--glycine ligase